MTDQEILKLIRSKEQVLKENLLTTLEAQALHKEVMAALDKNLPAQSIAGLRYRKLKDSSGRPLATWWVTGNYPTTSPWAIKFEPLLKILEQHLAEKTITHRLETEGLFIESRTQEEGGDEHLLIGKRDGSGEKAHMVMDAKTGEIRVEDNQKEPTEMAARVETILTLPNGKKIKTTREAIEELPDEEKSTNGEVVIELDKEPGFNPITTTKDKLVHNFILMVSFFIKNLSDQKVTVRNINAKLVLPEGYQNGMIFTDARTEAVNPKDLVSHAVSFKAEIINGGNGALTDENLIWTENKNKILGQLPSAKILINFTGEYVALSGTKPLSASFDITRTILPQIKK